MSLGSAHRAGMEALKTERIKQNARGAGNLWRAVRAVWFCGAMVAFVDLNDMATPKEGGRVVPQYAVLIGTAALWPLVLTAVVVHHTYRDHFYPVLAPQKTARKFLI